MRTIFDLSISNNHKYIYLAILWYNSFEEELKKHLLDRKKCLFGEVSWSLLHQVLEKEKKCEENKYPAPKLAAANLHHGICKQNVAKALAIFEPSTIAADRMDFPEFKDAAGFLHLVHVWKTISSTNARSQCNDRLGNAT